MKKYLLTSAAALALGGLFTGCTHDLDSSDAVQSTVIDTYEKAFITAFGQPDPNNEWGFGTSVSTSRAMTRATGMPSMPTFRDGEGSVPTIIEPTKPTFDLSTFEDKTGKQFNVTSRGKYKVNSESTIGEMNNNGCDLYVVSDMILKTFSAHGTNIIVAAGKKLTLEGINQNVNFYLEEGAELIANTRYEEDWSKGYKQIKEINSFTFDNNYTSGNTANLYMSKSSKLTGIDITFKNGYKVLNEGGTISTTNLTVYDANSSPSTLWNEGGITVTNNLSCENERAYVYNGDNHTISVGGKLRLINNYDLVYNNGTIDIEGDIYMENTSAEIINNDSLLCAGNFDMKAGGAFHNNDGGIAVITGDTYIYNTNSRWMNDGHYTTGTFEDRNCEQVYNNCYMTVLGEFYLGNKPGEDHGHSNFVLNGGDGEGISGAYVKADSFTFGKNTDLWLGNKSFIDVTKTFDTDNINSEHGAHGPSSGSYAVIKAASFTKQGSTPNCMTYYGKLYIDTPIHYSKDYYVVNDPTTVKFSFEDSNKPVSIPRTECNPGYNDDHHEEPSGDVVRVICEDLTVTQNSDFDFNDVVFDVQLDKTGTKVILTFRAAGGTLPLTVAGREVHELFAEANPGRGITRTSMINTRGTGDKYTHRNCSTAVITIDNVYRTTVVKEVAKAIPIQVQKLVGGELKWVEMKCDKGKATAKVAVDDTYNWCDERENINQKYRVFDNLGNEYGGFSLFVRGVFTPEQWYRYQGPLDNDQVEEVLNH